MGRLSCTIEGQRADIEGFRCWSQQELNNALIYKLCGLVAELAGEDGACITQDDIDNGDEYRCLSDEERFQILVNLLCKLFDLLEAALTPQ
jgi:hypothetical protein